MMLIALMMPLAAHGGISGNYTDPGGGTYWCNVYISSISNGKSYGWCTGDDENWALDQFRGFECADNGTVTTQNPTLLFKFRYHKKQSKDFNYDGSNQQIFVKLHGGSMRKIVDGVRHGSWSQTDYTWGRCDASWDGEWFVLRYAPNERGLKEVEALQFESETWYHQSNFWHSDYDFRIFARYLKDIKYDLTKTADPTFEWTAPDKVRVKADNSGLPSAMGANVTNFQHSGEYAVTVHKVGSSDAFSRSTFTVKGRSSGSTDVKVPIDKSFTVDVTYNTKTSFDFNGSHIEQNPNENSSFSQRFAPGIIGNVTASFNQVESTATLNWSSDWPSSNAGEFLIYRTELDEHGDTRSNREDIGSTKTRTFTDNAAHGLELGKRYRYEVIPKHNGWGDLKIPDDPAALGDVFAGTVTVNTTPVIPLHIVQDDLATDNIKFDWTFGNVPKSENDITFKVHRIEPGGAITRNYLDVTVPRTAGKASFSDEKPESRCTVYGYFLQLDLADNRVHIYSDTIYAHVLGSTTVTNLYTTKGTAGNSVVVNWNAKQVGTTPTLFDVQRRFIGGSEWISIQQTEGTASLYTFTDNTTEPGRYYEYRVIAYDNDCDGNGRVVSNMMNDVGFSQASGVVSGRVQFDTGTAVDNVRVSLLRESDEQTRAPYFSRHVTDDDGGITCQINAEDANKLLDLSSPFTIQMWINPGENCDGAALFAPEGHNADNLHDGYMFFLRKLTINGNTGYVVYMKYAYSPNPGGDTYERQEMSLLSPLIPFNTFSHVTIRNNGKGNISCLVNGHLSETPGTVGDFRTGHTYATANGKTFVHFTTGKTYTDGRQAIYTGYVDEIRFWNRALTDKEVTDNYNRILSGREDGLKLYWTFDEGLEEYAFDGSFTNGTPNGNHALLGKGTRPSEIIPDSNQLSAYSITNERGEYEIRGIPFSGSGTRYSVYPSKGIHSFNPTSRSAFIGGTSLTINNADFTDVSSFKVSGTIRYAGTTIPVDSVSFYVDGTPCNKNDKIIVSNAEGEYEISVPIGSHYIEARRNGHTFVNAGRYPADPNETYEFLNETHIDFFDNTTVTLAGRVTGGQTQGSQPLGYGKSENTIGKAEIRLTPLDHPQRMLNAVQHVEGTTVEWRPNTEDVAVASASTDINSVAYRKGGSLDDAKYIVITTDGKTGEFSALVPPIRYRVESVKLPKNPQLDQNEVFLNIPAINLTNPKDSVRPDTIYSADKKPLPLFKCNKKLLLTYRSNPVMDIRQNGLPAGAYGADTITVRDAGKDIKLPIFKIDEATNKVTYNYGYPIFQMGRTYNFKVKAYEPYMNYDEKAEGKEYKDALRDSIITFGNELGEGALIVAQDSKVEGQDLKRGQMVKLTPDQVRLDQNGEGTYKWIAHVPSMTAPYTRNMNASTVINGRTMMWSSKGLDAVIAGVVPTGNNFITAGPSRVQMVLRDPPGDASTATWATDSVTCDYTYTVRGVHNNTEMGVDIRTTMEFDFLTGTAFFGKLTWNTVIGENLVSWKYDVNKTWDNHTSVTYTNSQSTSTSASDEYVGRDGDVFIGYSTNYIIGAADKVGLFKQQNGSWAIGMQETMAMDEKFNTHFEYSQKFIETTLFSNIRRTRNSMLKRITSLNEIEENPARATYYTLLSDSDPKFGSCNNDQSVWGADAKNGYDGPSYYARFPQGYEGCDSVMWCNEVIKQWEKTLADNEEDKVKAFADAQYKIGNESFETGNSVTQSTGKSSKDVHNSTEVFTTGLAYRGKNGFLFDKMGAIIISNTDIGYHQTKYAVDETTTNDRFSYTLNDTQRNNSHTVDIFKSTRGWGPIFRTRGGQTRCPYEGATKTRYYHPGRETLDYATMRSDNPHISMPIRNFVDIPAGQEAQIQVRLTNESETQEALCSVVLYVDQLSNPNGLQIFMDGQPLLNGTEIWLEYGAPLTKTLTIRQSDPSVLDYNNVKFVLGNSCKPQKWIYETVEFSAHFVPAAPNVTLKVNKKVLNLKDVSNGDHLVTTISDINRLFTGLKGVRLKYRFAGDSKWITAHEWVVDDTHFTEGHATETQTLMPTDQPNIVYNLTLPDIDGNYFIAAESMCDFGGKEYTAMTDEIEIVKDTRGPKLLGQAYPNTGILTPTDDIRIKFNEKIRESYLTKDTNFFITGLLNDSQVSHDVALQFNGTPVETEAYLPISNTSFASSMWLKHKGGGTLFKHGTEGNNLSVSINAMGHVETSINGKTIVSPGVVPPNKWVFLAMNYVKGDTSDNNTFSMIVADDANETMLFDDVNVPDYNGTGQLELGRGLTGMMHELVLWNMNTPVREQLEQKDEVKAAYLPGLLGYWKMDEGYGTTVNDCARGFNIHLPSEMWNIENNNLAAHLDGQHTIKVPIGSISPRPSDSYLLEAWFRGEAGKNAGATLFSVTDRIAVGFDNDNSLIMQVFNEKLPSLTTSGTTTVLSQANYNDGNWHHLALNVRRGVSAVVYVDGAAVKTLAEMSVPEPSGDYLHIGAIRKRDTAHEQLVRDTQHFTGDVDEVRIWNAAFDGTSVSSNRYNEIDTTRVAGLVAYYPMSHSRLDASGNVITEFSLNNKAPKSQGYGVTEALGDGVTRAATAPALRTAPLRQNLDFDFTASDDEIFINLKTLPARMHGNMLTFTVKNVRDMCDNLSEPITWSATVDYNTLEWEEDFLAVEKDRLTPRNVLGVLINRGNKNDKFTLTGLPKWIQPSAPTGTIGINSSTTIQFTVGANAPVGTHFVIIYACNSDGISTPLLLMVTVRGNEPAWTVNPNDFESSMNIIGQIYLDDKICGETNTKIAAFVDNKCCGVASPQLLTSRDAYFVNMIVYGTQDITSEQPITFRIYDAERGVVLGNVITTLNGQTLKLAYRPNDLVGSYDTPVMWKPSEEIEQLCAFKTGWNWISLYAEPEAGKNDLESVFGHSRVFTTIKGKTGFAMNSGTKWTASGLETVEVGKLYKVKVKTDADYSITGHRIDPKATSQTISSGWNWIGPLSIYNLSLDEAFADLKPTRGDIVKSKSQVAFYDGYKWEGDLTALIPGMGYYYKSLNPDDVTFHYPTINSTYSTLAPAVGSGAPACSPFTPVDHHRFSDNMNVVAHVYDGDTKVDTLTVAAFINGECRGVAKATDSGYYLLTIAGNAEESGAKVAFATVYKGEVTAINETLTWMSDVIHGDLDNPTVLTISTSGVSDINADGDILITPTLVRDVVKVRAGSLLDRVSVYSTSGAQVQSVTRIGDNAAEVDMGRLQDGVYFVEAITAAGKRAVKRIVKL